MKNKQNHFNCPVQADRNFVSDRCHSSQQDPKKQQAIKLKLKVQTTKYKN